MKRRMETLALAAILFLAGNATKAGEIANDEPAVDVDMAGRQLVVATKVSGVAVSVSAAWTDGSYVHREFAGVGVALVDLTAEGLDVISAGSCNYEVRVHPPVDHEAARMAAERGDVASLERLSALEREQTVVVRGRIAVVEAVVHVIPEAGTQRFEK